MNQLIMAIVFTSIFAATSAYNFNVNWIQNPKESLDAWSGKQRFQINDNLMFKYSKADSVFVVKKNDFSSCNASDPIQKLQGGSSNFQLTRSGPYYFISGDAGKCANGLKMMVVVLSPRTTKTPVAATPMVSPVPSLASPPSTSPSSSSMPPSLSSPSMAPSSSSSMPPASSMAPSMSSPSMSPSMSSPSMAPSMSSPSMSPSMSSMSSPSMAPSSSSMTPNSPSMAPTLAPAPASAGSTLGVAGATVLMAVMIVANVFLG